MQYEIGQPLHYMLHGKTHDMLRLDVGAVVQGVSLEGLPKHEADQLRKAEQRERERAASKGQQVRLLYFKAHGVVRYAEAISHLRHTRRKITVPVEATWSHEDDNG